MQIKTHVEKNQFIAWIMVSIAALFYGYEFILRVAPSTMFHEYMRFYHITATQFSNIIIFYSIAYTPMQLLVGLLLDKYGVKKLLIFAAASCICGSYILSGSTSVWFDKAGLFLLGLGSAFAFVGVLKLAATIVNRKYLGLVSGITTTMGMLGAISGQSISAYINIHAGWQYTWKCYALIGVLILTMILCFIWEPKAAKDEKPISNTEFFKQLLSLMQNKTVLLCGMLGGILYMFISVFGSLWGIPYLTSLSPDISSLQASSAVAMVFIGMAIGCPLAGIFSRYYQSEKILIFSSIGVSVLSILLLFIPSHSLIMIEAILFVIGLICGPEVLTFTIAVENSPKHLAASAVALVNFIMMSLNGLLQYFIGIMLNHFWNGAIYNGVPLYSTETYRIAISIMPISACLITFLFILFISPSQKLAPQV